LTSSRPTLPAGWRWKTASENIDSIVEVNCEMVIMKVQRLIYLVKYEIFLKKCKKSTFSKNQKTILWLQKWNKTHLAVLLGYETIIWDHHSWNPGFCYVLMPAHCVIEEIALPLSVLLEIFIKLKNVLTLDCSQESKAPWKKILHI